MKWFHILRAREGQSLAEILIGLVVGGIVIGAATVAISAVLRANTSLQKYSIASAVTEDLMGKVRASAEGKWQHIANLTKGSATSYFMNASGSTVLVVEGKEGVLENDVQKGLVAYWKFDEAGGGVAYDFLGNNHGSVNGATATTTSKVGGYAKSFNGSSNYVNVASLPISTFANGFTWAAWMKTNVIGGWSWIFSASQQAGSYVWFQCGKIYGDTNIRFETGSFTSNTFLDTSGQNIADNNWHHIACVWDRTGGKKYIYVDGVAVASSVATVNDTSPNYGNLYLGAHPGPAEYWNGLIDEARVYNRALSADEIKQLYGSTPFTRSFSVFNICRSSDASSTVTGITDSDGTASTCGESTGVFDSSTQKVTVTTDWNVAGKQAKVSVTSYLTRWKNEVFQQADWSGGPGQTNPLPMPDSTFSSSSNIDYSSGGSIRIQGL